MKSKEEFLRIIENESKLVLFCFCNWSSYSVIARRTVEHWTDKFNRKFTLIDNSDSIQDGYFNTWLRQQESGDWFAEGITTVNKYRPRNRLHAYGELCWIRNGAVVGFECVYGAFDSEALEKRTIELFEA